MATIVAQRRLTLLAVLGLAYWLFGNLYESIVLSPNWIVDSAMQLERLNAFFVNTSPTIYFVPLTQAATVLVWILWWRNRIDEVRRDYRRAGVLGILATGVNAVIVATVVPTLFGEERLSHVDSLTAYGWAWNILNVVRMVLVGATLAYAFRAFRTLDVSSRAPRPPVSAEPVPPTHPAPR